MLNKRLELSALDRHGTEFPIELDISVLRIGGAPSFSAFVRNITERKRIDDDLRRATPTSSSVAYLASHDLQSRCGWYQLHRPAAERYRGRLDDKPTSSSTTSPTAPADAAAGRRPADVFASRIAGDPDEAGSSEGS